MGMYALNVARGAAMRAGALLGLRATVAVAFVATAALAVTLSRGGPTDARSPRPRRAARSRRPRCGRARPPARGRRAAPPPGCASPSGRAPRVPAGVSGTRSTSPTSRPPPARWPATRRSRRTGGTAPRSATPPRRTPRSSPSASCSAPGQTAHAALDAAPLARCRPVRATGCAWWCRRARSGARYVRRSLTACAARAARGQAYLRVHAIQPGPGPGVAADAPGRGLSGPPADPARGAARGAARRR